MATKRYQGKTKVMFLPVTTSTVLAINTLVAWASGLIAAATSITVPGVTPGVLRKAIAAADADYATARLVPVEVPVEKFVVWKQDFTASLVAADLGAECDLTDSGNANRGAASIKIVQPVAVISTTQGLAHLKFGGSY